MPAKSDPAEIGDVEPLADSTARQARRVVAAYATDADEKPFVEEGLHLFPVGLSAEDVEEYYEGFSNATLWPLYHDVIVNPIYHREWWDRYVEVNRRFAEATLRAAAKNATVWVQDY